LVQQQQNAALNRAVADPALILTLLLMLLMTLLPLLLLLWIMRLLQILVHRPLLQLVMV
jgi:hypothetical protein